MAYPERCVQGPPRLVDRRRRAVPSECSVGGALNPGERLRSLCTILSTPTGKQ